VVDGDLRTYHGKLGHKIRILREKQFPTQMEFVTALALRRVKVTNKAVSEWERGQKVPRTEDLWAIADTLGVDLNTLIPRRDAKPREFKRSNEPWRPHELP